MTRSNEPLTQKKNPIIALSILLDLSESFYRMGWKQDEWFDLGKSQNQNDSRVDYDSPTQEKKSYILGKEVPYQLTQERY